MRIAACLVAVACAGPMLAAQGLIEWSTERGLTKDDFKGRVPAAAATTSLSWINIDASWQCEDGKLVTDVRATFDPAQSWWRAAQGSIWESNDRTGGVTRTHVEARRSVMQRDLQLLEHEQLHFDLAELAVRKVRERFAEMKGSCNEPELTGELQHVLAQIDRELQEEQRLYDRETNHGTNEAAQDRWKRRIRNELVAALQPDPRARPRTTTPPRQQ